MQVRWKTSSGKDYGSKQKILAGTNSVNCISMISSPCRNREPLMNTSVTGALWQHLHCADFPCGSFQKLWRLFLQGEATAGMVKNVTKPLYLRRSRWAAGEPRALQSSCWAKSLPWHVIIILYFLQDNTEAEVWQQLRAGTEQHTGMEQVCCSSPELHYYRHCQVWQFACTLSPFLGCNMSGKLSSACPHSQTLSPTSGGTNDRWTEKAPACTPGLLVDSEWLHTPQPRPREDDFLIKHPCVLLFLINTPKQLLSTSLKPYACYIHKSTFSLKIFKLKLLDRKSVV